MEIVVRYMPLPVGVNAFTKIEDFCYNIYINANISREGQALALLHELSHIKKNHFADCDVDVTEREADVEIDIEDLRMLG